MENTQMRTVTKLSKDQKQVIASTSAGFALENMDVMFLSFALIPMISSLHISQGQAGFHWNNY